jgi:hypothetical protein
MPTVPALQPPIQSPTRSLQCRRLAPQSQRGVGFPPLLFEAKAQGPLSISVAWMVESGFAGHACLQCTVIGTYRARPRPSIGATTKRNGLRHTFDNAWYNVVKTIVAECKVFLRT